MSCLYQQGSLNFLLFEIVFNTKIDKKAFKAYLDEKDLAVSDGQVSNIRNLCRQLLAMCGDIF